MSKKIAIAGGIVSIIGGIAGAVVFLFTNFATADSVDQKVAGIDRQLEEQEEAFTVVVKRLTEKVDCMSIRMDLTSLKIQLSVTAENSPSYKEMKEYIALLNKQYVEMCSAKLWRSIKRTP